jgi:hypothetical protein
LEGKIIPELSKLVIEVDSKGVLKATGDLEVFARMGHKAGKSTDDVANKMGALQLIANKLPGPLKSVAAGLMGMVNPTTAVIGVVMELGEAAVKYVGEAVNAYAEHEAQLVRLGAVLKATGAESWTTTGALTKYANELQSTTGKSADEITRMQSVLLGFTSITGENFNRLTKNMLDMVDVMGGDMVSAANTFGKAMDNPAESLSALSRYGFKFTEEEKNMVKAMQEANDIAGAQVVILKSMEKAFGGASEAHLKTIQGMKEYIKTLKEQHKALLAEEKNWAGISKEFYEHQISYYAELNEKLSEQIELRELLAKKELSQKGVTEEGEIEITFTLDDSYREIELKINKLKRDIKQWDAEGFTHEALDNQLKTYQEILEAYKPIIDYEKQRLSLIERQAELLNKVKASYTSAMNFVNEIFDQTPAGQIEKVQGQIDKLIQLRNSGMKTVKTNEFNPSTLLWEQGETSSYLEHEEISKIDKDIEFLKEKLKNLYKSGNPFKDWEVVLARATDYTEDIVHNLGGLKTIEKYAEDGVEAVKDRFLKAAPDGGLLYEMLGMDKTDVLDEAAGKMRTLVRIMTEARIKEPWDIVKEESYQKAVALLKELDKTASNSHFAKFIAELNKEIELLKKSPEEIAIHNANELLKSNGIQNPTEDQAKQVLDMTFEMDMKKIENQIEYNGLLEKELRIRELIEKYGSREKAEAYFGKEVEAKYAKTKQALEVELDLQKKLLFLGEERYEIEKLIAEGYDEAQAKKIYALNQEIEKTKALIDALNQLKEAGLQITASGLVDFAHDLGSAFRDGTISSDELSGAVGNMLKSLIDAMPQLLLNVGLQLIMAKRWALGLAFIGASGLMSFVSGVTDSKDNGRDYEAERLRRIQDQISDLIDQMRKQEEYYATKKRSVNASAVSVNDAIITPRGTVYTHPEDYIIATKRPESLMSGAGAGNVFVNIEIENNAPVTVNAESETMEDGVKKIKIIIDQAVKSGIANGEYDGAFNAMNSRRRGREVQN